MSRSITPIIILLAVSVALFSLDTHTAENTVSAIVQDTIAEQNRKHVEQLKKWLGDRASKPAEEVFKDIQIFKGQTAERVLGIMEMGYSRSLGVGCAHCHDTFDWASDAKEEKAVTRAMVEFTNKINDDLLANMHGLKSENPRVRCSTCHRGKAKPTTDRPGPGPGARPGGRRR